MTMKNKDSDEKVVCVPREIMLEAAMIRLRGVHKEIEHGYKVLKKYHKTVTIFGSARLKPSNQYYKKAEELGRALSTHGYAIVTGGGGGIMEAANKGASEAMGNSIGFNIALPHEQTLNPYTTDSYAFSHFAPRKIVMTMFADAYVYFPGGFGTLDELTEILTLIQTGKTAKAPVILVGREFWDAFEHFEKFDIYERNHLINKRDEKLFTITDDIDEVVKLVLANDTYCDHSAAEVID